MGQFVTVSKTDKSFWPMLTGEFSEDHLATPVRNLNVNSSDEMVTFKIVDKKSLSLFSALLNWYSLARHIYLVFPAVGGLSYLVVTNGVVHIDLILFSMISLQFFLLSLTLYNDYSDYVNGVDRINEHNVKKPIVQGLVRPFQAKHLSIVFLALAGFFASYCIYIKPSIAVFAVLALLFGISLSSTSISGRYKGISLVATFMLGGPLLVIGFEYLLYGHASLAAALLGAVFGYHALKYDFTKQVRDIYYSSKANLVTLSTWFGFEKSKIIYAIMSFCHLLVLGGFCLQVGRADLWLVFVSSVCFEGYINSLIFSAPSFLSSQITQAHSIQKLHYTIESTLFVFIFLSPLWLSL